MPDAVTIMEKCQFDLSHCLYSCVISPCICVRVFLQAAYTVSVPEDLPVNNVLLRIGAMDADVGISAWIQYSLHGPGAQDFSIDPDTGMVIKPV